MNDLAAPDAPFTLAEDRTLKIVRLLPGPLDRVWAYLTESDLRRQWLAAGRMELKLGAPVELVWRNDELSDPPSPRPAGFPEEQRLQSRITELVPLKRLSLAWEGSGDLSYDLEPQGENVRFTVTHRRLPSRELAVMFAAGLHVHLDILAARLGHGRAEPFWQSWTRLRDDYDRRLPV